MDTLYFVHSHQTIWAHDSQGNPMMSEDIVIEFAPAEGPASYWYMPECVGSFSPSCTACGTTDLGEAKGAGILRGDEEITNFIKEQMGERWGYNDRLRSNAYQAVRAAKGVNA